MEGMHLGVKQTLPQQIIDIPRPQKGKGTVVAKNTEAQADPANPASDGWVEYPLGDPPLLP